MTAPRVTSCPHCKTSFRITQTQLRAANGSVRCGFCLQVFEAQSRVGNNVSAKKTPSIPKKQLTETSSISQKALKPIALKVTAAEKLPEQTAGTSRLSVVDTVIDKKTIHSQHDQNFTSVLDELDEKENKKKRSLRKQQNTHLIWGSIACFFTISLALQYAWFNRDTLSLKSSLRPAYEVICKSMNCLLPPQIDIKSIKSLQLLVRSHPDIEKALLVDAVIVNNANHLQPYPVLELSFADINGNLVANREFSAGEYLAGELAGSKEMPIGQPIRLGLEIVDPGQDAVNYALSFRKQ